jgi:hypothetical protein
MSVIGSRAQARQANQGGNFPRIAPDPETPRKSRYGRNCYSHKDADADDDYEELDH